MIFRRKKGNRDELTPEERFEKVYEYTKDLTKGDFKRFIDGIALMHEGHEIALKVKSREEREDADITAAKNELAYEEIKVSTKESKDGKK